MESLVIEEILKPILITLAKAAASIGIKCASRSTLLAAQKSISRLQSLSQEEIDAKIEQLFGENFAQQLLDIQTCLNESLTQLQEELKTQILKYATITEYRTFQQRIHAPLCHLNWLLQDPTSQLAREKFIVAYNQSDPLVGVDWLHKRLTSHDISAKLSEEIAVICGTDWKQFAKWSEHICLTLSQACYLHAAYVWLQISQAPKFPNNTELGNDIRIKMLNLQRCVVEILKELENGLLRAKSYFLFQKCPDKKHTNCGSSMEAGAACNELSAKIYGYLAETIGKELTDDDVTLVKTFAETLRSDYPQFEWSVIMYEMEKEGRVKLHVAQEKKSLVWLQELGSVSTGLLRQVKNYSMVMSEGLHFGQILACHFKPGIRKMQRKIVVYWTETKNIPGGDLELWFREAKNPFLYRKDVRLYTRAVRVQMDLAKKENVRFPFCRKQGHFLTATWRL